MSHTHYIENLLELKGVNVININNNDTSTNIYVEVPRKIHKCPVCGENTDKIHDYRIQKVKDLPIYSKLTYLYYRKRRYVCTSCKKRFYEDNPFVAHYQHKTSRLNLFILDKLKNLVSMSFISKEYHVSITTIARILNTLSNSKPKHLPEVLSIDEFKGDFGEGKYQCIITDPKNKKVLDITTTRTEAYLNGYFRQYPKDERYSVKFVVIDMWKPYYSIMKQLFPKAIIIIDKFHFVRQVTWALENTRKRVQKTLDKNTRIYFKRSRKLLNMRKNYIHFTERWKVDRMLQISDDLKKAHQLKEYFYYVMEAENSKEASRRLDLWMRMAKESNLNEFKSAIRAFNNWREPILNSFDHPYTNGFTEGYNNKIKVLKRVSFGLQNFSRARNRILHLA